MVLQALRQRVGLRPLAARPGAGLLQQRGDGDVVLGEPRALERVAVDDPPVEADVVEVDALEVEVDAGLAADELGLDRRRRVGEADDAVVDDLAVRAADDDAPGPQRVPPLVVGEVVEAHATAEVERRERRRGVLRRAVAAPAVGAERVGQRRGERPGRHDRRLEADAQQAPDHRDGVVEVRRADLHRGRRPDHALLHDRQPCRVPRHQQVLLGDLDEAAVADVGPERAQAGQVRRGRRLGEHAGAEPDELARGVGHRRPGDARDDEVGRPRAQQRRDRLERGRAPARGDLGAALGGAADDAGGAEAIGRRAREAEEELGAPAGADDAEGRGGHRGPSTRASSHAFLNAPRGSSVSARRAKSGTRS